MVRQHHLSRQFSTLLRPDHVNGGFPHRWLPRFMSLAPKEGRFDRATTYGGLFPI
jgi:hypothetical protein